MALLIGYLIFSFIASVLVVAIFMLSARLSRKENLIETYPEEETPTPHVTSSSRSIAESVQ